MVGLEIDEKIRQLANKYSENLATRVNERLAEMRADDRSHFLIYRVLGVT